MARQWDPAVGRLDRRAASTAAATHSHAVADITGTFSTVVYDGDAAGGDLSGTYPNPSVTDDSHAHTAATLSGTTYTAASVTVQQGTLAGGHTVTRTQTRDGDSLQVTELTGADPLRVDLGFTGVVAFHAVVFHGYYEGSASHVVQLELYNVTRTEWEVLAVLESRTSARWYTARIASSAAYLDSGAVTLRVNHLSNGVNTHNVYIDYVALQRAL